MLLEVIDVLDDLDRALAAGREGGRRGIVDQGVRSWLRPPAERRARALRSDADRTGRQRRSIRTSTRRCSRSKRPRACRPATSCTSSGCGMEAGRPTLRPARVAVARRAERRPDHGEARLLRSAGRAAHGQRRRDQEGVPQARLRAAPGSQPRRQRRGRGAVQGGRPRPTRCCATARSARATTSSAIRLRGAGRGHAAASTSAASTSADALRAFMRDFGGEGDFERLVRRRRRSRRARARDARATTCRCACGSRSRRSRPASRRRSASSTCGRAPRARQGRRRASVVPAVPGPRPGAARPAVRCSVSS